MTASTGNASTPSTWQRHVVAVLALVAVLHSVVLTFWLAPSSPVRHAVGDRQLAAYVNPYFEQSGGALAPNAQFVDESFRMRARILDDETGKKRVTRWIDVTAVEDGALRHDIDPARVHVMARRLATNLNGAMYNLDPGQRSLVQTSYTSTPVATLRARMQAAGNPRAANDYLTYDEAATRFASMYAKSTYDGQVLAVQYRIGRRTVPDISERGGPSVRELDFDWFDFGFRRAFTASYESQTAFDASVGR